MGSSAATGIVDANLRAFRVANLHVISTSTFPSGGGANPTFMLMAFALRAAPKSTATIIMLALAAVWLGPIILIVMTSIKSNEAFLAGPFALPTSPTLAPYFSVWASMQFGTLLANSLLYATVGSALAVLLALVPAFGLSRMEVPGKRIIFGLLLTGLMLP